MAPNWKPSRTARKIAQKQKRTTLQTRERNEKAKVRRRDRFCRFPLCGCRRLGLALDARPEVSHQQHKGMGGNPTGDRSVAEEMILMCFHRHQDGIISRHKGTLRARYLTPNKANGPIAWDIDVSMGEWPPSVRPKWREVARETAVQQWEPFTPKQLEQLEYLALMKW